ncbi:MAG TPA: hypothetical protein VEM41_09805 [Actinomycetota bacterium]|nr:hypothetical protein [Actinomycetota bacterium]
MSDEWASGRQRWAEEHAFAYQADVPDSMLHERFYLYTLGEDHPVVTGTNLLTGSWNGTDLSVFDVLVPQMVGASGAGVSIDWIERDDITVAMVRLDADLPYVYVEKKGLLTRAADDLDRIDRLHHDHLEVTCGARDFDKHFEVKTTHPDYARELFDHPMMEALLESGTEYVYETEGDEFIVHGRHVGHAELPALLDAAKRFSDHIPPAVLEKYAPGWRDGG